LQAFATTPHWPLYSLTVFATAPDIEQESTCSVKGSGSASQETQTE
jgi:hypothetical protein